MAYVNDPAQSAPVTAISDTNNPAARAYALARIQQIVNAHLLGAMPSNMADPAAVWRGLSQGLGGNHAALEAFLAAGQHPAVQQQAPQLVSEHGYAPPTLPLVQGKPAFAQPGSESFANHGANIQALVARLLPPGHQSSVENQGGVERFLPSSLVPDAIRQALVHSNGPAVTPGFSY